MSQRVRALESAAKEHVSEAFGDGPSEVKADQGKLNGTTVASSGRFLLVGPSITSDTRGWDVRLALVGGGD